MATPELRREHAETERQARGRDPRALGAYYTPSDIAIMLTRWALRENPGPVLDPSYGVCRFLDAAVDVLAALGSRDPERQVYGIDVDADATAETTSALVARGAHREQFHHEDFFRCAADPRYAAVLGNPPYVRHQWQDKALKDAAAAALEQADVPLSRRASLWAPFVVHADRFVREGGRLAMLLPGAAIQAQYAEPLWRGLAARYRSVTLIRVGERAFADALEETVVLLGDSRSRGSCRRKPLVAEVATFERLQQVLSDDPALVQFRKRGRVTNATRRDLTTRRLLDIAAEQEASCKLGDVATVRIGTVTGANAMFLRAPADKLLKNLSHDEVVPVVPRSGLLLGALWKKDDDAAASAAGERCRLMRLDADRTLRGRLNDAVMEAKKNGVDKRSHCQRRDPWWAIPSRPTPAAFLAYMTGTPKGLVLNHAGSDCINGVHRVDWIDGDGTPFVLSTWTSLWALAIEQAARHYAGGVLKLEPGIAQHLPVVRVEDASALAALDAALRSVGIGGARALADRVILEDALGFSRAQIQRLRQSAVTLAARRSPPIRSAG